VSSKEKKLLEIAIDERCKVIILIEKIKDSGFPSKTFQEYKEQATEEIEKLLLEEGF
jgi:hypothetical protein